MRVFLSILLLIFSVNLNAQDDLLDMLEEESDADNNEEVFATWKTMKLVNIHSTEMVKKNALDFRVAHRFGNMGVESGGGPHSFYGLDNSADIRISFDYGITERWQIGIGRSKYNELIDFSTKYKILAQKEKKVPVTIVAYGAAGITPEKDPDTRYDDWQNRMSYFLQVLIARKFGQRFSMELAPSMLHRNMVTKVVDPDGNTLTDENTNYSLGVGARFMITKRVGIIADYVYTFSEFRENYSPRNFYDPFGVGVEIETGGHVFHLTLTNASGLVENNYIPETNDSWAKGGIKLGFNISRVFQLAKH
ncbi:MAG: hypothetical protein CL840_07845 [Crocinitomicaceae bacterium]|nr:hypothetical protein [Crocinitomicaceae bacterium]|tara:strand:- start:255 stop:1175 length:921 start_codon:yes stop_codon:yes gene_type:complete